MVFSHDSLTAEYWFEDCPMLNPTLLKFAKSNKKYLFVYQNELGEYLGDFFDEEPNEDIFIESHNRGDQCGALFERDFTIKINDEDIENIEKSLILIDQAEYQL